MPNAPQPVGTTRHGIGNSRPFSRYQIQLNGVDVFQTIRNSDGTWSIDVVSYTAKSWKSHKDAVSFGIGCGYGSPSAATPAPAADTKVTCVGHRKDGKPCKSSPRVGKSTCTSHADQEPGESLDTLTAAEALEVLLAS